MFAPFSFPKDMPPRMRLFDKCTFIPIDAGKNCCTGCDGGDNGGGDNGGGGDGDEPDKKLPSLTWTRHSAFAGFWDDLICANDLFIAVAETFQAVDSGMMTSPNATDWSEIQVVVQGYPNIRGFHSIAHGNGRYIAVNRASAGSISVVPVIFTSTDLINWTVVLTTQTTGTGFESVIFANGLFVAVGGTVMTSPDGLTWTKRTLPNTGLWYRVPDVNGFFFAPNESSLPENATLVSQGWYKVKYVNGLYFALGRNIMTSPDGITWTVRFTPSYINGSFTDVAYGNGRYVVVAAGWIQVGTEPAIPSCYMVSTDAINWSSVHIPSDGNLQFGIAYHDGLFVTVGSNSYVLSFDGLDWHRFRWGGYGSTLVTYAKDMFITIGSGWGANCVQTSRSIAC
jgi:hypothetical protein